jgi:hypothetical protein
MKVRVRGLAAIAAVTILAAATPAFAGGGGKPPVTPLPACGPTDITAPGLTLLTCDGFKSGNLLNQSPANVTTDKAILAALGYTGWDGKFADAAGSVSNLKGNQTVNFGVKLTGISIVGVHFGAGKGATPAGPGQESTAFYVLDAAQGVNQIHLAYGASSNAVLFVTGLPRQIGSVPEPATWATMVGGFGLIGGQMRRRRRTLTAA